MKAKKNHIVYLSYDGITDPLGKSQILPYVLAINSRPNYKFTIVSFEKKHIYKLQKKKTHELLKENFIDWKPMFYTKNPPIFSTIFDILRMFIAVNIINKNNKINLIHCRSYISSLVALKYEKKIPFLFDMRGFYADERLDGKIWNKKNFTQKVIYNYFKRKELDFLQKSSHTISLTKTAKIEIESMNLRSLSEISVIPCCTDKNLFNINNIKNIKSSLGITKTDFVISYVGSIGTWYMVDEMLIFFKQLKKRQHNAKFLFITKDSPEFIYSRASVNKIDHNCLIIKSSPREEMPSHIACSNFSIFFILPVFSKKASSPTKMGEIMNLGIPIICNTGIGDVDEIMEETMPELLVKSFSNKEYNRVINLLINNQTFSSNKIIDSSIKYYSLSNGVNKYIHVYSKILNSNKPY